MFSFSDIFNISLVLNNVLSSFGLKSSYDSTSFSNILFNNSNPLDLINSSIPSLSLHKELNIFIAFTFICLLLTSLLSILFFNSSKTFERPPLLLI